MSTQDRILDWLAENWLFPFVGFCVFMALGSMLSGSTVRVEVSTHPEQAPPWTEGREVPEFHAEDYRIAHYADGSTRVVLREPATTEYRTGTAWACWPDGRGE